MTLRACVHLAGHTQAMLLTVCANWAFQNYGSGGLDSSNRNEHFFRFFRLVSAAVENHILMNQKIKSKLSWVSQ